MIEDDGRGPVHVLAPDLVLVDWGPMTLTISVWDRGQPRPVMASLAAWTALESLSVLADFQHFLRRLTPSLTKGRPLPEVVRKAYDAVRAVSHELTSLAAVAGAVADMVADRIFELGADKVIVNNGGDIASRLSGNERIVVGLKSKSGDDLLARLTVKAGEGIGGIASSGWAGRSFSPGVADLVSVWAKNASLADAAATIIAGRTSINCPAVKRAKAVDLDPSSDLGDMPVTVEVGQLSPQERDAALAGGLTEAERLLEAGLIRGCFLAVQGHQATLDPDGLLSRL